MKRSRALIGITAASAAAAATLLSGGTTATAGTVKDPIADGLAGPLQFTFNSAGRPLVAQSFMEDPGMVTRINKDGSMGNVVTDDGAISGVAYRDGRIAYTLSGGFAPAVLARKSFDRALRGAAEGPYQLLKLKGRDGRKSTLADLGRAEANRNPDSHQVYGWLGHKDACEGQPAPEGQEPRGGIAESNPHSVAAAPGGGWYVADAAANVVWKVKNGKLTVVRVFKPRSVTITPEIAAQNELDPCTIGTRYNYEPVPTDVEVGPDGALFVSLLPGEGNAPGAPFVEGTGAVVKVNPRTGRSRLVAQGFTGTTNVALAPRNRIFVAEMFANKVTQVNTRTGAKKTIAYLDLPAGLEFNLGKLYVSYGVFGPGKLSVIDPTGPTAPPPPPPTDGPIL